MTDCILCGGKCTEEVYRDFYYCSVCGIATRSEDTINKEPQKLCTLDWVKSHSESRLVARQANYILKRIRELSDVYRVLDVGCGSGVLVGKLCADDYNAEGIDSSEQAVSFALDNVWGSRFRLGDASLETISGEGIYDLIVATHLVEHLENPSLLLSGTRRLLKPNGFLYVSVPNLSWYNKKSMWRRSSSIFTSDHVSCFTAKGLAKLLTRHGFTILDVRTRTHGLEILTGFAITVYRRLSKANGLSLEVGCSSASAQSAYETITSFPIFSAMMYIPNRLSERNYGGSELIILAKVGGLYA